MSEVATLPYPVILASASPRRRELLGSLVAEFTVEAPGVDEESMVDPDPRLTARNTAGEKARAVFRVHPDAIVIAGDTVVALPLAGGFVQVAKPADVADAVRMLRELSGRVHHVITGVCILWPGGKRTFEVRSQVRFRILSDAEIADYVATGEPMDKAGAYGAQGHGAALIEHIEGSRTNVIGLPMDELAEALRSVGQ